MRVARSGFSLTEGPRKRRSRMATVPNLALSGAPNPGATTNVDRAYQTPNRILAASPVGATTPLYVGEIVLDEGNNNLWKAEGTGNQDWVALTVLIP